MFSTIKNWTRVTSRFSPFWFIPLYFTIHSCCCCRRKAQIDAKINLTFWSHCEVDFPRSSLTLSLRSAVDVTTPPDFHNWKDFISIMSRDIMSFYTKISCLKKTLLDSESTWFCHKSSPNFNVLLSNDVTDSFQEPGKDDKLQLDGMNTNKRVW